MVFFPTCHTLITWFELSRVKLYRNELKGNKKLLRVSTRFELLRVLVTEGKITVNVRRKSRGNRFWFKLGRGSSQRGFELSGVNCIIKVNNILQLLRRQKNLAKAHLEVKQVSLEPTNHFKSQNALVLQLPFVKKCVL